MLYRSAAPGSLLSLMLLAACGGGGDGDAGDGDAGDGDAGDGDAGDGDAGDGDAGDGDAGDGDASNGECGITGATVVAEAGNYDDSIIARMVVLDAQLFFATIDQVYSVPISGGEPLLLYPPEPTFDIYPPFWVLGDELVVGKTESLDAYSISGGPLLESRPLTTPYSSNLSGTSDILLASDGKTFYGKYDPIVLSGNEPEISYWKYDYQSDELTTLLEGTAIGHHKRFVLSGDALFTAQREGEFASATDPTSDTLHSIPTSGGPATEVPLTGSFKFDLIGADDTDLYFAGRPAPFDAAGDPGGFYRVSRSGGTPEQVIREYVAQTSGVSDFILDGERAIVWHLGKIFSVPLGAASAELVLSTSCEIHAIAVDAGDLYLSTFNDDDESASILRVPLP